MLKIIYNGMERADFVYYLSTIISSRVASVIVNDISKSHDLYNAVHKHSGDDICTWANVTFVKDLDAKHSQLEESDVYIEYQGENFEPVESDDDTTFHVMSDYTDKGMDVASQFANNEEAIFILRDFCTKKITDKSFAMGCNIPLSSIVGHMALNQADMAAYVAFTHNGMQKFGKCSEDMHLALSYVVGKVLNIKGEKELKKVLAKANKRIR